MLAMWAFTPAQDRHNYRQSVTWGIASIIPCWLIFAAVYAAVAWAFDRPHKKAES
jgi:hypothetical protein